MQPCLYHLLTLQWSHLAVCVAQDDPTPLEWMFYFGFWVLAAIIFAVKLRRGTLIHAESRKQRMEREMAMSTTPLLCAQVLLLHPRPQTSSLDLGSDFTRCPP